MSTAATDEAILAAAGRVSDPIRPLPFAFAKRHGVLVLAFTDEGADVAVRQGASPLAVAEVRRHVKRPLRLEPVDAERFEVMLRQAYEGGSSATMDAMGGLEDETDLADLAQDIPEPSDLLESEDEAPVIRLINALLTQSVKENASDIHIEPFENRLVIRFRVDGVLRARGRRARLDHPGRTRRTGGAASPRQAGGPARPALARHGYAHARDRR